MRAIVFLDNGNSRVYCIDESLIATYFNNKNGFYCVVCFFTFLPPVIFVSFSPIFSLRNFLTQTSSRFSFSFFFLDHSRISNPHPLFKSGLLVYVLYHYTTGTSWKLHTNYYILYLYFMVIIKNLNNNLPLTLMTVCTRKWSLFLCYWLTKRIKG